MPVASSYPRDIPPLWLLIAMAVMAALHTWLPLATVVPQPWSRLGFVVIGFAMVLLVASARCFRRRGTGIRPFSEAVALVEEGPFRHTRNPMYLGLVGVTFGMAVCLGTASPLVVPPLFFLLLRQRFVLREERFLRDRFGAAFDAYCARTRRWF